MRVYAPYLCHIFVPYIGLDYVDDSRALVTFISFLCRPSLCRSLRTISRECNHAITKVLVDTNLRQMSKDQSKRNWKNWPGSKPQSPIIISCIKIVCANTSRNPTRLHTRQPRQAQSTIEDVPNEGSAAPAGPEFKPYTAQEGFIIGMPAEPQVDRKQVPLGTMTVNTAV